MLSNSPYPKTPLNTQGNTASQESLFCLAYILTESYEIIMLMCSISDLYSIIESLGNSNTHLSILFNQTNFSFKSRHSSHSKWYIKYGPWLFKGFPVIFLFQLSFKVSKNSLNMSALKYQKVTGIRGHDGQVLKVNW